MKYIYLFLVGMGFAVFVVAWFKSIKNQVVKHHPHKMKRRHPPIVIHHTPAGGVPAQH